MSTSILLNKEQLIIVEFCKDLGIKDLNKCKKVTIVIQTDDIITVSAEYFVQREGLATVHKNINRKYKLVPVEEENVIKP